MKKILLLFVSYFALFVSSSYSQSSPEEGQLTVEEFLKVTTSKLSEISRLLRNKGFSPANMKDEGDDIITICWTYNCTYNEKDNDFSFIRFFSKPAWIRFKYDKQGFVFFLEYSYLNNTQIHSVFEAFNNELEKYGYEIYEEEIVLENNTFSTKFHNNKTNTVIELLEYYSRKNFFSIFWIKLY